MYNQSKRQFKQNVSDILLSKTFRETLLKVYEEDLLFIRKRFKISKKINSPRLFFTVFESVDVRNNIVAYISGKQLVDVETDKEKIHVKQKTGSEPLITIKFDKVLNQLSNFLSDCNGVISPNVLFERSILYCRCIILHELVHFGQMNKYGYELYIRNVNKINKPELFDESLGKYYRYFIEFDCVMEWDNVIHEIFPDYIANKIFQLQGIDYLVQLILENEPSCRKKYRCLKFTIDEKRYLYKNLNKKVTRTDEDLLDVRMSTVLEYKKKVNKLLSIEK